MVIFSAALLIAVTAVFAYLNTLNVPLVLDDGPSIAGNQSIHKLWPLWGALHPPLGTTVSGRPVANLTLALNYSISGTEVWSYHALNLLIHCLSGIVLFGIVRRNLLGPCMSGRFGSDSLPLALVIALIWILHPLQTEAVTYTVQRVESLMGFFYLMTLYCVIRAAETTSPRVWQGCALAACLLGMGTKEVMASAPFVVFFYDRTFLAGSFRKAWAMRRGLYLGLAATGLPLVLLVEGTGWNRQGSAGFTGLLSAESYWLTQSEAIVRYLSLSLWPTPLIFDYGTHLTGDLAKAMPFVLIVTFLFLFGLFALWRRAALGFLAIWFFAILGPTSLIPVPTQTIAEHRMYLPLAAVVTLVALGVYGVGRRWGIALLGAAALALGVLSYGRNEVYRSELTLWSDTVVKRPESERAHCSLGLVLSSMPGRTSEALLEYYAALKISPYYADAHTNLGILLEDLPGRMDEAIQHLREAARILPNQAEPHYNLGVALGRSGHLEEACAEYETAVRLDPGDYAALANLGVLLCGDGLTGKGIERLEAALRIKPDYAQGQFGLGNALVQSGKVNEALRHYGEALKDRPDFAEASNNMGIILYRMGSTRQGLERIEAAIRMRPDYPQAHFSRGAALIQEGRQAEAVSEFEEVLRLKPDDPGALRMLELIRTVK